MGVAGVQTWELSAGMLGALIMETAGVQTCKFSISKSRNPSIMGARCVQTQELSIGIVLAPNGNNRGADSGTQYRGGGNPSECSQQVCRLENLAQRSIQ